jgi:hypothetical protein
VSAIATVLLLLSAQGESMDLREYRARLQRIQEAVDRSDLEGARKGARDLQDRRVTHEGMALLPDVTVLAPIARATTIEAARDAARRLRTLRAELDGASAPSPPSAPDGALLERLRQEEQERALAPDRSITGPVLHGPEVPQSFWQKLAAAWEWMEKVIERFLKWLARLFFGAAGAQAAGVPKTQVLVVGLLLALIGILAAVAVVALRKRRGPAEIVARSQAPAMSAQDADPLSRSAGEWERFAAELMRSGRYRESIRAWYHALLVSLFRAGTLHYRKDRTNWEYAYALPSTVPWRSGFMDATRTFEQEWYGRRDTPVETAERFQERVNDMLEAVREGAAA